MLEGILRRYEIDAIIDLDMQCLYFNKVVIPRWVKDNF